MKRFTLKKKIVTGVAVASLALGGTAAYAFFTSTGSGSGTGTVGTTAGWTVAGGSVVGTLYPDADHTGPDLGVVTAASVTNGSGVTTQHLNQVVATISSVTTAGGGGPACALTDFQFDSPANSWSGEGTQAATILPNINVLPNGIYPVSDLNVVMVDNGANQDRCKAQTVTVTLTAS